MLTPEGLAAYPVTTSLKIFRGLMVQDETSFSTKNKEKLFSVFEETLLENDKIQANVWLTILETCRRGDKAES